MSVLPLYRPGSIPASSQAAAATRNSSLHNVQRRIVHYISQPLSSSSNNSGGGGGTTTTATTAAAPESPRDIIEPLFVVGKRSVTMIGGGRNTTSTTMLWIGGAVLAFWVILVTLFFASHIVNGRHAATVPSSSFSSQNSIGFTMLPTQGHFFNVSLLKIQLAQMGWHRTCCWHQGEALHCDGSGMFTVYVDKPSSSLVVKVVQPEIIGAQCTFHWWSPPPSPSLSSSSSL